MTSCPLGQVAIADLGLAMLTATELPHERVERLGSETWQRARSRWELLRLATGAIEPRAVPA